MRRALLPLFSTPLLELTPLLEFTSLWIYPSLKEDGYFYIGGNAQGTSAPLLDSSFQADSILRVNFITSPPFTTRMAMSALEKIYRVLPALLAAPLLELTPLLEFTSLWVYPSLRKGDLENGKWSEQSHHSFGPMIRVDYILRADSIFRHDSSIRVHFIMSRSLAGRGRFFFTREIPKVLRPLLLAPLLGLTAVFKLNRISEFTSLQVYPSPRGWLLSHSGKYTGNLRHSSRPQY